MGSNIRDIKFRWVLLGCFLFIALSIGIPALTETGSLDLSPNANRNDTRREEVQRYFGYESLLFRYLTLPYDISMNVNQKGDFVDIGYLFLVALPVFVLIFLWKKKWAYFLTGLSLVLLLIISVAHSNIVDYETWRPLEGQRDMLEYLEAHPFQKNPINHSLASLYLFFADLAKPVEDLFANVTGDRDFISYPILISLFLILSFFLERALRNENAFLRWSLLIIWVYGFFWFILASGIIWYGYLFFALSYVFLLVLVTRIPKTTAYYSWIKIGFFTLASMWILTGFVSRISNVSLQVPEEHRGKGIILPSLYNYNLGRIPSEAKLKETLLPNVTNALKVVNNSSQDLVYRVGTSLTYYIQDNHKRVIQDNQLGLFQSLLNKYPEKEKVNDILKASQIRFLIIDLNTPSLDNTPEKSLLRKFQNLINYVQNNPGLTLLATDRVISRPDANGEAKYYYDLFGERVSHGTYAIYRIN